MPTRTHNPGNAGPAPASRRKTAMMQDGHVKILYGAKCNICGTSWGRESRDRDNLCCTCGWAGQGDYTPLYSEEDLNRVIFEDLLELEK